MSRKKISTTIYITPAQSERLKMLHQRTKVPVAVYIREGIDMVLKHYEHWPAHAGRAADAREKALAARLAACHSSGQPHR